MPPQIGNPVGEEPGCWRGFALPRLQRLHGPLVGEPNPRHPLGIVAPAHVLGSGLEFPPTLLNIVLFVIASIPFTIVLTWVFNNTKGSLLIAILVRATFNMTFVILNLSLPPLS